MGYKKGHAQNYVYDSIPHNFSVRQKQYAELHITYASSTVVEKQTRDEP